VSERPIDRATAEKERGLLEQDYAEPCPNCGGVVFEWWDSDTCQDCATDDETTEQTKLVTDGGTPGPDAFHIPTIAELDAMRAAANLSMRDFSECAGFKDNRWSHILNNDVNPHTQTVRAFLTALQEFDGHTETGNQGPDPSASELVEDDGPTEVDVDQIAARLDRLDPDAVGEDPTPPEPEDNLVTDGGQDLKNPAKKRLAGETEVTFQCSVAASDHFNPSDPEYCGHEPETIELDEPASVDENNRIHVPGRPVECPECGQPVEFEFNGVRVMFA